MLQVKTTPVQPSISPKYKKENLGIIQVILKVMIFVQSIAIFQGLLFMDRSTYCRPDFNYVALTITEKIYQLNFVPLLNLCNLPLEAVIGTCM